MSLGNADVAFVSDCDYDNYIVSILEQFILEHFDF